MGEDGWFVDEICQIEWVEGLLGLGLGFALLTTAPSGSVLVGIPVFSVEWVVGGLGILIVVGTSVVVGLLVIVCHSNCRYIFAFLNVCAFLE